MRHGRQTNVQNILGGGPANGRGGTPFSLLLPVHHRARKPLRQGRRLVSRLPLCHLASFSVTLPNQLTILRLFLTVIFVIARESGMAWGATVAVVAFGLAVLSDYLDGVLARRLACETDFGRLMDPLADKVLIAAALVCLAWSHDIPAWAAILLISRDFLITGLRQLALSHGTVLAADPAGKTKTASQMIMIGFFLLRDAVGDFFGIALWPVWVLGIGHVLLAASVILSVYSGWRYTRAHWSVVVRSGRS